jgi:hypothetical protein
MPENFWKSRGFNTLNHNKVLLFNLEVITWVRKC